MVVQPLVVEPSLLCDVLRCLDNERDLRTLSLRVVKKVNVARGQARMKKNCIDGSSDGYDGDIFAFAVDIIGDFPEHGVDLLLVHVDLGGVAVIDDFTERFPAIGRNRLAHC